MLLAVSTEVREPIAIHRDGTTHAGSIFLRADSLKSLTLAASAAYSTMHMTQSCQANDALLRPMIQNRVKRILNYKGVHLTATTVHHHLTNTASMRTYLRGVWIAQWPPSTFTPQSTASHAPRIAAKCSMATLHTRAALSARKQWTALRSTGISRLLASEHRPCAMLLRLCGAHRHMVSPHHSGS